MKYPYDSKSIFHYIQERDESRNNGDILANSVLEYLKGCTEIPESLAKALVRYSINENQCKLQLKLGCVEADYNCYNDKGHKINEELIQKQLSQMIDLDLSKYYYELYPGSIKSP